MWTHPAVDSGVRWTGTAVDRPGGMECPQARQWSVDRPGGGVWTDPAVDRGGGGGAFRAASAIAAGHCPVPVGPGCRFYWPRFCRMRGIAAHDWLR